MDDYFREYSKKLIRDQLNELLRQLTELGRILSETDKELDFPDISLLRIEGGRVSVQIFIY